MYQFLLVIHVIVAVLLVTFILLQQGKGASTGAAFGSGASTTVFGSQGSAGFMSRTTWALAIGFFVINLGLAFLTNQYVKRNSIDELQQNRAVPGDVIPDEADSAPAEPGTSDIPGDE